jgi:hypothetical protein
MTQKALGKVWSFFALTLLTLSVLFFLRTTGATPKGDLFGLLAYGSNTIALLALPFELVLFAITLALGWAWSARSNGASWAERLPVFYFEHPDVDPTQRAGKLYQGIVFFLTLVLPVLLIGQMYDRFRSATIYDAGEPCLCDPQVAAMKKVKACERGAVLRFGEAKRSGESPQADGPEFFCWEPTAFATLSALVALLWLATLRSVLGGRGRLTMRGLSS